jgi:hypothetical protein
MIEAHQEHLRFHPEEQTLGPIADELFLDLHHRIMTAHFGPGTWFLASNLRA